MKKKKTSFILHKFFNRKKINDISYMKEINEEWTGTRSKKILECPKTKKQYLFKIPRYGPNESMIEVFNSILATELGLNHTQYFKAKYKDQMGVCCQSFISQNNNEELWEMKEMICRLNPTLEAKMGRTPEVRKEHNIENIYLIISTEFYHGNELKDFFKMIGFDILIGHGDRHWENYGFIVSIDKELRTRFSPIYDTASGFLSEYPDTQLDKMISRLNSEEWYRPNNLPKLCKISVPNNPNGNHFDLLEYILRDSILSQYKDEVLFAFKNYNDKIISSILKNYFPEMPQVRKKIIQKILKTREQIGKKIMEEVCLKK